MTIRTDANGKISHIGWVCHVVDTRSRLMRELEIKIVILARCLASAIDSEPVDEWDRKIRDDSIQRWQKKIAHWSRIEKRFNDWWMS